MNGIGLYIDLLKRSLLNLIYGPGGEHGFDMERRLRGRDWPRQGKTMVGSKALDNIQSCVEAVLHQKIPGDLLEAGVWRGGACILMRAILKAHGVTNRRVWVADSFRGLPPPDPARYPADTGDLHHTRTPLAISLTEVKENFRAYGLLDDQVKFLEGFFRDTLPKAPVKQLALLRLDGDMYESTIQTLEYLYPKLSPGGFLIVDDYMLPGAHRAVDDYRKTCGITAPLLPVDTEGRVYWRKERTP